MKKILAILLFTFSSLLAIENLTLENFDEKVKNKNVILDFYATWWYACKTLGKSLTKYNTSKKQDVTIYKVDIDAQKELAKKFNVRTVPTLIYLKDGKFQAQEFGVKTVNELKQSVEKHFK